MTAEPGLLGLDTIYARVQQFYTAQMRRLDERDMQGYADTFTMDAEFTHNVGLPPSRTRSGIFNDLTVLSKRHDDDLQFRHWVNMIDLKTAEDGALESTVYCLVVKTWPGKEPVFVSCVLYDVLVEADGRFLTRSRRIEYDDGRV